MTSIWRTCPTTPLKEITQLSVPKFVCRYAAGFQLGSIKTGVLQYCAKNLRNTQPCKLVFKETGVGSCKPGALESSFLHLLPLPGKIISRGNRIKFYNLRTEEEDSAHPNS